ncbi:hypothetical protein V8F20_004177 [Naviculisporaceae sp. PSN 640]
MPPLLDVIPSRIYGTTIIGPTHPLYISTSLAMPNTPVTHPQIAVESDLAARYQRLPATSVHASERGDFELTSLPGRVGTPRLWKLPIHAPYSLSDQEADVRWNIIKTFGPDSSLEPFQLEILGILRREGVKWPSNWKEYHVEEHGVDVEAVKFPGVFMTGHPTVFISAYWDDSEPIETARCWENAVVSVKKHIDAKLMAQGKDLHVGVYIQAHDTIQAWHCEVANEEDLPPNLTESAWRQVKNSVHQEFFSAEGTTRNITSISLLKRAKHLKPPPDFQVNEGWYAECPDPTPNDPLTVFITVDYESNELGWGQIINNLRQLITAQGLDLDVHMEYNDFDDNEYLSNYPNYSSEWRPQSEKPNVGAAIGAARYVPGHEAPKRGGPPPEEVLPSIPPPRKHVGPTFGTLGCWLKVRTRSNPTQWIDVALASYHALRPAIDGYICGQPPVPGSPLSKADWRGVKPRSFQHALRSGLISYPPRMNEIYINRSVATPTTEADTDWVATNALGRIWYASGHNRRASHGSGGQLDWALILPSSPEKVGQNKDLQRRGVPGYARLAFKEPVDGGLRVWESISKGERLGLPISGSIRSSDLNDHYTSEIEKGAIWTRYHCEEVIYKTILDIKSPQDAGSMVFDNCGRTLVDMEFPVSPIENIFEDVIGFSDGEITEVKLAEA